VGKQDLLESVVADLRANGIGDRSLRDLAAAVGTSHRMLIHHFGSRAGLLTEVVRRVEAEQRAFLGSIAAEPADISVAMWERLREPAVWPNERLFFECYARAARGEAPYASLLPGLVDDWLDAFAPDNPSDPAARRARAEARLSLALFRGLLLDLVGTEDREGVDAAFDVYRRLEAIHRATPSATS
jgi:AcrR family transcriptional regulator